MRKTKEILRLHHEARRSGRHIARTLGLSPATVQECLRRARIAGVDWKAALDLNDTVLEDRLYPPPAAPTLDGRCRTSPTCTPSSSAKA
jgi:hypothetical protein